MNDLILVDIFDHKIGNIGKKESHEKPMLHRAFSVFLFRKNQMLIQQRAFNKYHSGGLFANTCCSHPRSEDILRDASDRLMEEVGISLNKNNLRELFSFTYLTKFNDHLFEYEFDHVIVGEYDGSFVINPEEVNDMMWVDVDDLAQDMTKNPQKYASWFLICAPKVITYIKNISK